MDSPSAIISQPIVLFVIFFVLEPQYTRLPEYLSLGVYRICYI